MKPGVHVGDCLAVLPKLRVSSIKCVVTEPPVFGEVEAGAVASRWPEVSFEPAPGLPPLTIPAMTCVLGAESDPWAYVGHLVHVFRRVSRALRRDGVCWVRVGEGVARSGPARRAVAGLPWRLASALQADGWLWCDTVAWTKPDAPPSTANDRCRPAWEPVLMLARSARHDFFWREIAATQGGAYEGLARRTNVWEIAQGGAGQPFPSWLPELCVLASCGPEEWVLDPFLGSGRTAQACERLGRPWVGIERNARVAAAVQRQLKAEQQRCLPLSVNG